MGFFDADSVSVLSGKTSHSARSKKNHKVTVKRRSRSRDRDHDRAHDRRPPKERRVRSRSRSRQRGDGSADAAGLISDALGLGEPFGRSGSPRGSSFFGLWSGSARQGRPSYYRRSPRPGLVSRTVRKIKKLVNDLVYYAKKHPRKVVAMVLVPLITGGALSALLARVGVRMPRTIERLISLAGKVLAGDPVGAVTDAVRLASGGDAMIGRGTGGRDSPQYERTELRRKVSGSGSDPGWSEGIRTVTRMFF